MQQIVDARKKAGKLVSDEEIRQIQEKMEKQVKEELEKRVQAMADQLRALQKNQPQRQPNEAPRRLLFSRDGEHLFCWTSKGLRQYSWPAVVAATGDDMPDPMWQYDVDERSEPGLSSNLALEVDGTGLLYGSKAGDLCRVDTASGEVRRLFTMPGKACIQHLTMSLDGQALSIIAQQPPSDQRRRNGNEPVTWSVWSYPRLVDSGTEYNVT